MENDNLVFVNGPLSMSSDHIVKLMMESLNSLGYLKTLQALEEESGKQLCDSNIEKFFEMIMRGEWDQSCIQLKCVSLKGASENDVLSLIFELKYVELLFQHNVVSALSCLQSYLSRYVNDPQRFNSFNVSIISKLKILSRLKVLTMMLPTSCRNDILQICEMYNIPYLRHQLVEKIKSFLSPEQVGWVTLTARLCFLSHLSCNLLLFYVVVDSEKSLGSSVAASCIVSNYDI